MLKLLDLQVFVFHKLQKEQVQFCLNKMYIKLQSSP